MGTIRDFSTEATANIKSSMGVGVARLLTDHCRAGEIRISLLVGWAPHGQKVPLQVLPHYWTTNFQSRKSSIARQEQPVGHAIELLVDQPCRLVGSRGLTKLTIHFDFSSWD